MISDVIDPQRPVTAAYIGLLIGRSTATVRAMAKRGEFDDAGVFFVGNGIMFDLMRFEEWRRRGGNRPAAAPWPTINRHGCRQHAGGRPRNDRSRRDPSSELADMVIPDPGVRPYDRMTEPPHLECVEPGRYLPGASANA